MFEGDSADTCGGKFSLVLMGGRAEGLPYTDPGARTPIGAIGYFPLSFASYTFLGLKAIIFFINKAADNS
jgi:hypothetical protein